MFVGLGICQLSDNKGIGETMDGLELAAKHAFKDVWKELLGKLQDSKLHNYSFFLETKEGKCKFDDMDQWISNSI